MSINKPAAAILEAEELNSREFSPSNRELKHTSGEQELPSTAAVIEEAEILHASIRAGSIAQIVMAGIAVIGLLYLLKLVMVTTLVAILLAFVLEPLVGWFGRIRFPRPIGALVAVTLLVCLAGNLTFFFYNRAVGFAIQLPRYSEKIRDSLANFRAQTTKIEESTRSVLASPKSGKQPLPVEVQEAPGLSRVISAGTGTLAEVVLAISFIPFLVYFMLTWKDHMLSATVRLFPREHRLVAHRTVGRISAMIRSFIVGNMLIGLIAAGVSTVVFWSLGIPYFYFLGVISGFVSLIPYLGVFLAVLPPLAAGIGIVDKTRVGMILLSVIGLHIFIMNVLYPKIVGKRLRLNPLVVTLSLFFWAWIWGAMGLILAVPVVGATKIICDYVDSLRGLGEWLGVSAEHES
jgi:predicted PurR-regulated permease PerM